MNLVNVTEIAKRLCSTRGWTAPEYIDNGASAAVFKVVTADGPAALKIYDPEFFEGENALIEAKRIDLQRELKGHGSPFLVEVLDAGELKEDGTWYLLMEFCPWKSLERRLEDVPDNKVHHLVKQLVQAVNFLDAKGLVHRDIKPANIVVSDDFDHLKLLDFGVVRRIAYDEGNGTDGNKFIATAQYSPPEFLSRDEAPGETGFRAINLYQVGAVLHDLITKAPIFAEEKATKNKFKLFKAVTEKRPRVVSASVPPRLIALCLAALEKDPTIRAAGVQLDDFLADADHLDALRRRVGRGRRGEAVAASPSIAVWSKKVRSWGMEAAKLESDTLGAVTMKEQRASQGVRWQLNFASADVPIYLDLARIDDGLSVRVISAPETEGTPAVLTIYADGPDLPETGIPGVLAAQYLYALDIALTGQATSASA
ncbi:protein kinase [Mesorhizobium sp. WSM4906]|uniref:protein kinase domain-containing protein n=1 Tax=Mesorhizobium sp. WSM4906 TaxID=3038546 RepID=UPI00241648F5|nr:protein kinase [Mesorhizobium sp. WSM4906]WFP74741.1 protein kinase [Mesorhizobium sp. WSM4906]